MSKLDYNTAPEKGKSTVGRGRFTNGRKKAIFCFYLTHPKPALKLRLAKLTPPGKGTYHPNYPLLILKIPLLPFSLSFFHPVALFILF